ncbi:unnamed protein product, partial [Adineta steineri]
MALKIKELETTYYGPLNEINREIIFKLFELSITRYSEVRSKAQNDLFYLFSRIHFSYQVIVDRIVELLKSTSEPDHDQIKNTNEKSICAAKTLWRALEVYEMQQIEEHNQNNIQSYNRLMETLSLLLKDSSLTWKEQEITLSLLCNLRQNRVPMPLSCIETFLDCLIHDHIEIRK